MAARHVPVLVAEVMRFLRPERGGVVVDCTVGLGGHARRILELGSTVRLIGLDRDPQALEAAREALQPFRDRARLVESGFDRLAEVMGELGVTGARGILADLGVSSLQLETAERGFSFRSDGPLDMRMGGSELTAAEIVNTYSEARLEELFRTLGEERQARRVARAVVWERDRRPIRTTSHLAAVVRRAKGPAAARRRARIDPATRVFQALRIEVNRELAGLEALLEQAVGLLEQDGRLVIISYHSLEDRIVKHTFRRAARGVIDPVTGRSRSETRVLEVLTTKPVRPSTVEVRENPRSRSARLRAARRI